jgi:hypothetical protein
MTKRSGPLRAVLAAVSCLSLLAVVSCSTKDAGTDGGLHDGPRVDRSTDGRQDTRAEGGTHDRASGQDARADGHSPIDTRLPAPVHVAIDLHYDLIFGTALACSSNVTWNATVAGTTLSSADVACYDYSYTRPFSIRFDDASLSASQKYYLTAYAMVDGLDRYKAECWAVTASPGEAVLPSCTVTAL